MTKRTKPKATPTATPTINSTAPVSPVESVKAESKARVASKGKQANSKAPAKPRGRPKKALVEKKGNDIVYTEAGKQLLDETLAKVNKAIDVNSSTTTYVDPMTTIAPTEPKPSLYDRFVGWLFKVTYLFRGY